MCLSYIIFVYYFIYFIILSYMSYIVIEGKISDLTDKLNMAMQGTSALSPTPEYGEYITWYIIESFLYGHRGLGTTRELGTNDTVENVDGDSAVDGDVRLKQQLRLAGTLLYKLVRESRQVEEDRQALREENGKLNGKLKWPTKRIWEWLWKSLMLRRNGKSSQDFRTARLIYSRAILTHILRLQQRSAVEKDH